MYKCPECGVRSSGAEWDYSTRNMFGSGSTSIQAFDMEYCFYTCPNCNCDIDGDEIIKIEGDESKMDIKLMDGYVEIDGVKYVREVDVTKEIKVIPKRTGFERVEKNSEFYMIGGYCEVHETHEANCYSDQKLYDTANYFSDEDVAKKVADMQLLQRLLYRFSMENGGDTISKYDAKWIIFNNNNGSLSTESLYSLIDVCCVVFKTKEIAEEALEEFRPLIEKVMNQK